MPVIKGCAIPFPKCCTCAFANDVSHTKVPSGKETWARIYTENMHNIGSDETWMDLGWLTLSHASPCNLVVLDHSLINDQTDHRYSRSETTSLLFMSTPYHICCITWNVPSLIFFISPIHWLHGKFGGQNCAHNVNKLIYVEFYGSRVMNIIKLAVFFDVWNPTLGSGKMLQWDSGIQAL